jgi:hypothetical protein
LLFDLELVIVGRFIRVCLYDGKNILSNIHHIKARVDNDETTWLFKTDASDTSKIFECSEMFLRCQMPTAGSNLGILFELSMHALKKVNHIKYINFVKSKIIFNLISHQMRKYIYAVVKKISNKKEFFLYDGFKAGYIYHLLTKIKM